MIADSSTLIIFAKVNRLELLEELFGKIQITKKIYNEAVEKGIEIDAYDAKIIKDFFENKKINIILLNEKYGKFSNELMRLYPQLDIGECEAISLCLQEKNKTLVMDEHEGRTVAKMYKIRPIGSLKILLELYKKNILIEQELNNILDEMLRNKFRLSGEVINEFWNIFEKIKGRKKI